MRKEREAMKHRRPYQPKGSERGAALVIGLLLLLVLTLLAVSGMNSASLEFVMAGNEQYRTNAFQAAEAGVEQAFAVGTFNPGTAPAPVTGASTATDSWRFSIISPLGGSAMGGSPGDSWASFATYHFEIQATGASTRGSNAADWQGVWMRAPAGAPIVAIAGASTHIF